VEGGGGIFAALGFALALILVAAATRGSLVSSNDTFLGGDALTLSMEESRVETPERVR